jgi:hypothetical protein
MSILLVEKGKDFPIRYGRIRIQFILSKIHWKLPQMLFCTTCTSFWASLISDCVLFIIASMFGYFYFFWPFSGAITSGIMWTIMEYINAIDKEQNINVFVNNKENNNE